MERDGLRQVTVVSPIGCSYIVDLHDRAINTSENPQDFFMYQIEISSLAFKKFYKDFCKEMDIDISNKRNIEKRLDYLKRINFVQMSEDTIRIMESVKESKVMQEQWSGYQKNFEYAADVTFEDACETVVQIMDELKIFGMGRL